MAAVNYFWGVKRGDKNNPDLITPTTATVGTAADVEVRIQINTGSVATGITKLDVLRSLDIIRQAITNGGVNHSGTDVPAL